VADSVNPVCQPLFLFVRKMHNLNFITRVSENGVSPAVWNTRVFYAFLVHKAKNVKQKGYVKMKEQQISLKTDSIGRFMAHFGIPCVISLLVAALYNIADQVFVANAPYLGSFGNAANTVAFPLTVVALAIAVMIGDGCCAFARERLVYPPAVVRGAGRLCCNPCGAAFADVFRTGRHFILHARRRHFNVCRNAHRYCFNL
jgi:hypothetical protein